MTMPDDEYQYYVHEDSDGRPKTGWFDDDDRLLDMLYQVHKTPRYDLIDRETARKIQRRLMEE